MCSRNLLGEMEYADDFVGIIGLQLLPWNFLYPLSVYILYARGALHSDLSKELNRIGYVANHF